MFPHGAVAVGLLPPARAMLSGERDVLNMLSGLGLHAFKYRSADGLSLGDLMLVMGEFRMVRG